MAYRSPLGYNFKLEKSLSASKEQDNKSTPKAGEYIHLDNSGRKTFDSDSRRSSGGSRNSPAWQRDSFSNMRSPNCRNDEPAPIEHYYHPSMLENPWEELERN